MTRDEALTNLVDLRWMTGRDGEDAYRSLRTYILNSIPTPTVEVEGVETSDVGKFYRIRLNAKQVYFHSDKAFSEMFANDLRAALGIEVKP